MMGAAGDMNKEISLFFANIASYLENGLHFATVLSRWASVARSVPSKYNKITFLRRPKVQVFVLCQGAARTYHAKDQKKRAILAYHPKCLHNGKSLLCISFKLFIEILIKQLSGYASVVMYILSICRYRSSINFLLFLKQDQPSIRLLLYLLLQVAMRLCNSHLLP